jgi:hypothetical protein
MKMKGWATKTETVNKHTKEIEENNEKDENKRKGKTKQLSYLNIE